MHLGCTTVDGLAALSMRVPMVVMWVCAKEPPDREPHQRLRTHVACLLEKDGWVFSLIYVVTFGGFIGITTFLPTYYYDQFGVSKVQAGQLTMLAAFMGAAVRVFPAHAGMNRPSRRTGTDGAGVPRTRGDEPATASMPCCTTRRSPHTRG